MEETERKQTPCEALGVENITQDETERMAVITSKALFVDNYHKSDAIIDLLKLFEIKDTTKNRRFCLAAISFGAAAERANDKINNIVQALGDMLPEMKEEEK